MMMMLVMLMLILVLMLMLMPQCQGFIHDDADYNAGAGADAAMPTFHKSHFNDHCH